MQKEKKENILSLSANNIIHEAENKKFVLKSVPSTSFADYQDVYQRLNSCNYLRVSDDTVSDQSIFVYRYLSDHLLHFTLENPGLPIIKRILEDTLRGIAAMHGQDIVHTGMVFAERCNAMLVNKGDTCEHALCIMCRYQTEQYLDPAAGVGCRRS